jgi:hypothetical protein
LRLILSWKVWWVYGGRLSGNDRAMVVFTLLRTVCSIPNCSPLRFPILLPVYLSAYMGFGSPFPTNSITRRRWAAPLRDANLLHFDAGAKTFAFHVA